jgi:hypothetical protein
MSGVLLEVSGVTQRGGGRPRSVAPRHVGSAAGSESRKELRKL